MNAHRNAVRNAACLVLSLSLAACGGILPKKEPLQIFAPQVHVDPDSTWPSVAWQLTVARPHTNDMLDSRRMLVSPVPGEVRVYAGAAWNDSVPDIVQDTIVHAFQDSGKVIAADRQTAALHADFMLQMELRDDQAVYRTPSGPPQVELTITASLVDYSSNRAVGSRTFREAIPASGTGVTAVVQAFDSALGAISHDIVGWTLATGEQARTKQGTATNP